MQSSPEAQSRQASDPVVTLAGEPLSFEVPIEPPPELGALVFGPMGEEIMDFLLGELVNVHLDGRVRALAPSWNVGTPHVLAGAPHPVHSSPCARSSSNTQGR